MTLNSVVLPAPFGPMSPVTVPASALHGRHRRARILPPKCTETERTSSALTPTRTTAGIDPERLVDSAELGSR